MSVLTVTYLPAAQIKVAARNARTHSEQQIEQIAQSITAFGWTNPILVDEHGVIIAGHGRLAAALRLGMIDVPTIMLEELSAAQKRALAIADNKLALNAGWDEGVLMEELEALKGADFDLSLIGFSDAELASILDRNTGLTDPDDVPEPPEAPISRPGDVWCLGRHRLVCGDATSEVDVSLCLGGVRPHLMVTDPPYGVDYEASWRDEISYSPGRARGKVENDDRSDWRDAWLLSPSAVAYVWHAGLRARAAIESLEAANFEMRAQIIWNKGRIYLSRGHYHFQHEPCWYAVRRGAVASWAGDNKQSTVWDIPKPQSSETGHSTQKPVECMRRPIENNSSPGQAVYDPFVGSSTTIIAAEMTGRSCHAIEISPAYCDVSILRWMAFTGETTTHAVTGRPFESNAP